MIRQYNPQRYRQLADGRRVGTIDVGTIAYIQDRLGRYDRPVCRNPWIVLAWIPRELGAATRDSSGRYVNRFCAGGHLAIIKSLRDGRVQRVADHYLLAADDLGLTR